MAEELSIDSLKDMKKADFIKAFKNKAVWKKAKSVIVLVDYKLDGKKNVITIPFKKEAEMKQEMKRLKKEKLHLLKKSGGGSIEFVKAADGSMEAKIEITLGGLSPEVLLMKGQPLFDKIKVKLQALQSAEAAAEAAEAAGEVDPNENLPEDDYEDVDDSEDEDDSEEDAEKEKRIASYAKMEENIAKMEGMVGSIDNGKLDANIQKYMVALQTLITEANNDGSIDLEEQKKIDALSESLQLLKNAILSQPKGNAPKLSAEHKTKIKENMIKISARLDKISKALNLDI